LTPNVFCLWITRCAFRLLCCLRMPVKQIYLTSSKPDVSTTVHRCKLTASFTLIFQITYPESFV
jgi:hypothetical protein